MAVENTQVNKLADNPLSYAGPVLFMGRRLERCAGFS